MNLYYRPLRNYDNGSLTIGISLVDIPLAYFLAILISFNSLTLRFHQIY